MCTLLWLVHCTAICQNLSSLATNFILWIGPQVHTTTYLHILMQRETFEPPTFKTMPPIMKQPTKLKLRLHIGQKIHGHWEIEHPIMKTSSSYKTIWIHQRTNISFVDKMWVLGNHKVSKTKIYNLLGTSNNTRHLCVVGVRMPTEHLCHEKEYNTLCLTYNAWVQY